MKVNLFKELLRKTFKIAVFFVIFWLCILVVYIAAGTTFFSLYPNGKEQLIATNVGSAAKIGDKIFISQEPIDTTTKIEALYKNNPHIFEGMLLGSAGSSLKPCEDNENKGFLCDFKAGNKVEPTPLKIDGNVTPVIIGDGYIAVAVNAEDFQKSSPTETIEKPSAVIGENEIRLVPKGNVYGKILKEINASEITLDNIIGMVTGGIQ